MFVVTADGVDEGGDTDIGAGECVDTDIGEYG